MDATSAATLLVLAAQALKIKSSTGLALVNEFWLTKGSETRAVLNSSIFGRAQEKAHHRDNASRGLTAKLIKIEKKEDP